MQRRRWYFCGATLRARQQKAALVVAHLGEATSIACGFHQDIVQGWHSLGPDADGYVHLAHLGQLPRNGKNQLKRLAAAGKDGDGKLSFKKVVQARMAYERQQRRLPK